MVVLRPVKPIAVLKRADGRVEVYGAEVPVVDEARLLRAGAQLYGVVVEGREEVYEDLHQALVALVYAHLQGLPATLLAYDREMRPVYVLDTDVHLG